jgi:biotin-dependent carboxylase-like uncharacterized protein
VAGRQTGVYPYASPGGWNLIGRTALAFFDPHADPPALLAPGDLVRFQPVDTLPEDGTPAGASAGGGALAAVEVVAPGLLTTVQDGGRRGWRRLGVSWAGAADAPALSRANAALGNAATAAGLECTLQGPTLRFLRTVRFALAGADLGATLERADLGLWPVPMGEAVLARAGNVLRFTGRRRGCRAYVALDGGLAVPDVLASRATDLAAGFGGFDGRALRAGDRLAVGAGAPAHPRVITPGPQPADAGAELRVLAGPQVGAFDPAVWRAFLGSDYEVRAESDRVGCRLRGPGLAHRASAEIVSDGMLPGCVQVPPDGQPIVMGPDGPTTGGYPKIAVVIGADLWRLGQLAPGEMVRFREVTAADAVRAREVS